MCYYIIFPVIVIPLHSDWLIWLHHFSSQPVKLSESSVVQCNYHPHGLTGLYTWPSAKKDDLAVIASGKSILIIKKPASALQQWAMATLSCGGRRAQSTCNGKVHKEIPGTYYHYHYRCRYYYYYSWRPKRGCVPGAHLTPLRPIQVIHHPPTQGMMISRSNDAGSPRCYTCLAWQVFSDKPLYQKPWRNQGRSCKSVLYSLGVRVLLD